MIEELIISHLSAALTVPVYAEVPAGVDADEYVVIERTGGELVNWVKSAVIAVQSYSKSLRGAAALNENVKEAMLDIVELNSIGGCHLDGDYNFTDTTKKQYRYQAVFFVTYY